MELLHYDENTNNITLEMGELDFADLADFVASACSAYGQLDEKVLGIKKDRAVELRRALYAVMEKVNELNGTHGSKQPLAKPKAS